MKNTLKNSVSNNQLNVSDVKIEKKVNKRIYKLLKNK